MYKLPMVSICVNLESSFTIIAVVTEQLLQRNDTSDGEGHLTGDERFTSNGC